MTTELLNQEVARITGEDIDTIKKVGFEYLEVSLDETTHALPSQELSTHSDTGGISV